MDIPKYKTNIFLEICPIWNDIPPAINILINDQVLFSGQIKEKKDFFASFFSDKGNNCLRLQLIGKKDNDPIQAIKIENIALGGISSKKFIWAGIYKPIYPELWATEQRTQKNELPDNLTNMDYLGWNGTWSLNFTVPVFTWIHQVENLGWIYN